MNSLKIDRKWGLEQTYLIGNGPKRRIQTDRFTGNLDIGVLFQIVGD